MKLSRQLRSLFYEHGLFLFIVLIAIGLRCYQFQHIEFTYDEYSTLHRTGYTSFHDLIEKGVKTDTHPALTQVLVHYWTSWFGYEPWRVKLPFLIMGILCIPVMYMMGKKWYGKSCGEMSSAVMATMQVMVYYSETARPYIPGVLIILLLAWTWGQFITGKKSMPRDILLLLLFTLAAFTHHFTMLLAGIIWLSTWFLVDRDKRIRFALLSLGAMALYLPHLSIFLVQLAMGGVATTTDPPGFDFPLHHLFFLFNYSWPWIVCIAVVVIVGVFSYRKLTTRSAIPRMIIFSWWILPLIVGFTYSYLRSPVLIDRVLVFSSPFLLLFLFSFQSFQSLLIRSTAVTLILAVGMYSLVISREHYQVITHTGYEDVYRLTHEYQDHPVQTLSFISAIDHVDELTKKLCGIEEFKNYILVNKDLSLLQFESMISESDAGQVTFAWTTQYFIPKMEMLGIIRRYFPVLVTCEGFAEAEFYTFSRTGNSIPLPSVQLIHSAMDSSRYNGGTFYRYQGDEFGVFIQMTQPAELICEGAIALFSAEIGDVEGWADMHLALSVERGDSVVYWKSTRGYEFLPPGEKEGVLFNGLRLSALRKFGDNLTITCSVWNPDHRSFEVRSLKCDLLPGNRNLYGHILPLSE